MVWDFFVYKSLEIVTFNNFFTRFILIKYFAIIIAVSITNFITRRKEWII